jgi:hypothetical protein
MTLAMRIALANVTAIKEIVRSFVAMALRISCSIDIASANRLKFSEPPNAGWGR